ncbi:MAG: formate dehydrogenase [Polaromonas sp.]
MQENSPKPSRRGFFFGAAAAGAAVAAVASLPGLKETQASAAVSRLPPEKGGGYRVTDHVERYYKTTRI